MVSSDRTGIRWGQVLKREWQRLFIAFVCIAVLISGLVVMTLSAEPGWLTDFVQALKKQPWIFVSMLVLAAVGALLPIAAAITWIVTQEKRIKDRNTAGG